MMIGASLVWTWSLVATDSSELDDDRNVMPSQTVEATLEVRDGSADATLVVSYPATEIRGQTNGTLSNLNLEFPTQLPPTGAVWGIVDSRPRIMIPFGSGFAFYRDIERGSRGADVVVLQEVLASLGHYEGEIDGRFGTALETALVAYRDQVGVDTGDKRLALGDLVVVSEGVDLVLSDLSIGTLLSANDVVGTARQVEPSMQLRFLPRDSAIVIPGSSISGDEFAGVVEGVDREPLATDAGTVLTGTISGSATRDLAAGETLQVTITADVEPRLWLPSGSLAVDASGSNYAVTPNGERIALEIGDESGGSVEIVSGASQGDQFLLPNPDLFEP